MKKEFLVVTLCGSTRFKDDFIQTQKELTLKGYVVISVGLFGHSGDTEVWEKNEEATLTGVKLMLDKMHKQKIDMADSIFVINPDGYIGQSTWSEICYAYMTEKEIDSMVQISQEEIRAHVSKHLEVAERLAWEQIDGIRHSDGYYNLDNYVHFQYKKQDIVDPWINLETHYDGTPWIDHNSEQQKVDPFKYYGKKTVAAYIEEIIMRRGANRL